jgi:hypothetical protein
MTSQSDDVLAKLNELVDGHPRGRAGIAPCIGYRASYVSDVLNLKKPVSRRFGEAVKRLHAELAKPAPHEDPEPPAADEWVPPVPAALSEPCPPYRVAAHQPLGYITNKGEKWEESVPFFADDALNEKAIRMAERLRPKAPPAPVQAPPSGSGSSVGLPEEKRLAMEAAAAAALNTSSGSVTPRNP